MDKPQVAFKVTPLELQVIVDALKVYKSVALAEKQGIEVIRKPNYQLHDNYSDRAVQAAELLIHQIGMS
jgi:hypothetical protein